MEKVTNQEQTDPVIRSLGRQLEAVQRTNVVLMDRIEKMAANTQTLTGLNLNDLAVQQLVRRRTLDLQRMNAGLILAATQHQRTDRIVREMQRIANIGGWELNVETGTIEITDQIAAIFNTPVTETLNVARLCQMFIQRDAEELGKRIREAHTQSVPFDLELETASDDGAHRTLRVVGMPLMEGTTIARVYGVIKDITRQKAAEFQLAQSQRLESIGQLAAGVAHEINTPVQYVSDNVRFIQSSLDKLIAILKLCTAQLDPDATDQTRAERHAAVALSAKDLDLEFLEEEIPLALSQSLEGLDRVTTIVRAMKDFSHPGSAAKEPADLNRSIASTIEVCRNRWKFIADLETDFAADLPSVPCFIAELNQVMLNLIINAADALAEVFPPDGGKKGRIVITTKALADTVEVRVQDNGPGIPPAVARRIFEPFFTTKPVGKGTGQGLTISRNVIVKKHGGRLTFDNAPGGGTVFTITLPLHPANIQESEAA